MKQQMPLKRPWAKQDKLTSKCGWKNIRAGCYQNPSLLLISFESSPHTQRKLSKSHQGTVSCTARHTVLQVRHWSLPQGPTHPTSLLSHAGCSNPQAAQISATNTVSPKKNSLCLDFNILLPAWPVPSSAGNYSEKKLFLSIPDHKFALAITAKGALPSKGFLLILRDVKRRVPKYASEGSETLLPI